MRTIWKRGEKTAIVTGGAKGIGYETAYGLAARGATVIIVGRDAQRGATAVSSIQHDTSNDAISFLQADLSSLAEIRHLAEQITSQHSPVHILVNNAGGANSRRIVTIDGLEATFATNHLAPFLLTNLLLPVLKASPSARIVNVNSIQHRYARIDFDDLQAERMYDVLHTYRQAKLANLFFTYELARRLRDTNVTVNAADPGGTLEGTRTIPQPFILQLLIPVFAPWLTPRHAAQSSIYLASSPNAEGLMGKYINFRKKVVRSAPISYDEATAEKIWNISATLVGL